MQTVYKRRAHSLTLEDMLAIRRWLRRCYKTSSDQNQKNELIKLGTRLNTCIEVASATDCEIAEW